MAMAAGARGGRVVLAQTCKGLRLQRCSRDFSRADKLTRCCMCVDIAADMEGRWSKKKHTPYSQEQAGLIRQPVAAASGKTQPVRIHPHLLQYTAQPRTTPPTRTRAMNDQSLVGNMLITCCCSFSDAQQPLTLFVLPLLLGGWWQGQADAEQLAWPPPGLAATSSSSSRSGAGWWLPLLQHTPAARRNIHNLQSMMPAAAA